MIADLPGRPGTHHELVLSCIAFASPVDLKTLMNEHSTGLVVQRGLALETQHAIRQLNRSAMNRVLSIASHRPCPLPHVEKQDATGPQPCGKSFEDGSAAGICNEIVQDSSAQHHV